MAYLLVTLLGVLAGGICVFLVLELKRNRLEHQKREQEAQAQSIQDSREEIERVRAEQVERMREFLLEIDRTKAEYAEFDARVIAYKELQDENSILKHDLQNVDVNLRKLQLDHDLQGQSQETLDRRSNELASRYLKDNIKWVSASLTPSNFVNNKKRLQKVIEWCRKISFDVPEQEEASLLEDLKGEYEKIVRAAFEREEQARIKAQIREEQKVEKEIERELARLERERTAIQVALDKALAEAKDEHSAEVEHLRARLAEAEENSQRAISRAQMTKSGHVYVISNIGSFGENVFKIGMTRRLDPMVRVKELGDASVPFPFDVHMMISSDDAPALETALHRTLHKLQLNRVNPRKEFFRTDIENVVQIVKDNHGEVQYTADAEALQYRQSVDMSEEDEEFIESVYDELVDEEEGRVADVD